MNINDMDEVRRGEEARQILENPMYIDALQSVRNGLISSMSQSPMGDEKTHNRLVIALQLLNQIEKSLRTHMETGKMAAIQLDEKFGQKLRRVAFG